MSGIDVVTDAPPNSVTLPPSHDHIPLPATSSVTTSIEEVMREVNFRQLLEKEHGVVFHARERRRLIPQVDREKMLGLTVKDQFKEGVEKDLDVLYGYLNGQAISDQWPNHTLRTEWRKRMKEKYGDIFTRVYESSNQLRLNVITGVELVLRDLSKLIPKDGELAYYCESVSEEITDLIKGEGGVEIRYAGMSTDEKIEVVRKIEDRILDVLSRMPQRRDQISQELLIT